MTMQVQGKKDGTITKVMFNFHIRKRITSS